MNLVTIQVFLPPTVAPLVWSAAGVRLQAAHPQHSTLLATRWGSTPTQGIARVCLVVAS